MYLLSTSCLQPLATLYCSTCQVIHQDGLECLHFHLLLSFVVHDTTPIGALAAQHCSEQSMALVNVIQRRLSIQLFAQQSRMCMLCVLPMCSPGFCRGERKERLRQDMDNQAAFCGALPPPFPSARLIAHSNPACRLPASHAVDTCVEL